MIYPCQKQVYKIYIQKLYYQKKVNNHCDLFISISMTMYYRHTVRENNHTQTTGERISQHVFSMLLTHILATCIKRWSLDAQLPINTTILSPFRQYLEVSCSSLHQETGEHVWLGVLTILKNMSSSMGRIVPYMKWKILNMFETRNQLSLRRRHCDVSFF